MRWAFLLLVGIVAYTATAQQLLTSYVRVQWNATNLTTIEANEGLLRSSVVQFLAPNITANVTFLEIRAFNANISASQNFTIEFAVQANASAATATSFLTTLLNTTSTTNNLTRAITTTIPNAAVVCDVGASPSSTRLRIAPTPPTLTDLAANASYVFTNLRYQGAPNANATNFTGTSFSLAQLTRMRYAFYSLLGIKNDEEATVVQVVNATVNARRETNVLVFFRFNSTSRLANTTITTLTNGTTTGNATTTLADAMALFNFTARNYNLTVNVPWTPASSNWWIVDATNATNATANVTTTTNTTSSTNATAAPTPANTTKAPAIIYTPAPTTTAIVYPTTKPVPTTPQPTAPLPTTIVPQLDGGLVPFPFIYAFNVTAAAQAPVYTQPGVCGGNNQFCLHLKWIVEDPRDAYVLARIKGQQFINSSVLASSYGPAFSANTSSVWTLYDIPRSSVILDLVRSSDLALVSIDISASLLSPNSATSTVTSTSNRNIYVRYAATPISAKELVLELRVVVGTPPPVVTQTLQDEGCAYCTKLASQCAKDPMCSAIKLCVDNATSVWDQTNLILNGDYGDSLNTTLATAACYSSPSFPFDMSTTGRDLYNKYMACMITRSCPFVVDGPSKLVWQTPTPGWIQIQLLPWSLPYFGTLELSLSYGNSPPCPVVLSNDNTTANLTQQLATCILNDCEVIVLANTTNVTTIDIVFTNHIGPMPELSWTPTPVLPYIDAAFAIIPKLASSSALALMPVNDPVTNPATPQNACSSCWLEFLQTCLLDEGCNVYINCIMKGSFESIATLIQFGRTGATFNLSPSILSCSDPTAPTWASWRYLQKASQCYAKQQCPVASQGGKDIVWQVPNRTQSISYTLPFDPTTSDSPPQFMFRNQLDYNWNVMYGGVKDFGSILPTILDIPDVVVSDPTNATNPVDGSFTYSWLVTYPSYAGFLPTYYIGDFGGNVLTILNDAPPSALLVVQNKTWNATAWNSALF
ncbi:hypothetical protein H310_08107 [Aphanomyces invadans]|uniref:Uncharacterized protein n=1 Tax=Aphanomyces invadans TaxID=157072 RepID=A0A024U0M4_9STRA|nr:hypothetical protein H310_08107 [Aphanomyces invadans]ETV99411.1 hypothetical protein H310_08107 [Aphanomyces invadans]|eukprot:XP_008871967.1 hypothetical protein H310_08107 [Aphanomyces invadans]